MINANLMLCDYAHVAEGKLYISGGGWTVALAMRGHIAVLLKVPWDQANHRIAIEFSLLDQDGNGIQFGPENANRIGLMLEVGRPPGLPRGTDLDVPIAIPLPEIALPPGNYEWTMQVNGEGRDTWHLPFLIVDQTRGPIPPGLGRPMPPTA